MYFIPHRINNDIIIEKKENKPNNINNKFFLRHNYNQFKLYKRNILNKIYPGRIIK
jgi:hypothetical protein